MELKVLRQVFTAKSTTGQLWVDGKFECFTLEDVVRPEKVFGETAIPAGRYQVVISMSERFKTRLPLLVDVPNYSGVRIHPGNTAADTLGCILVGQSKGADSVGASRAAFGVLLPKLEAAAKREKIFIDVVNDTAAGAAAAPAASRSATRGKGAAKKVAAKKVAAKKLPAKKAAAKKLPAKQAPVKQAAARKAAAKKSRAG